MTQRLPVLILAAAGLFGPAARADQPPPSGVVNLSSSASSEVTKDLMTVTFTATRDGPDANSVQAGLKQALDAALAEARRVARPGQLEPHTGNFSLFPRYTNKAVLTGWQGTAELVVEGRDMTAIGQLVGRIASMTVGHVGYGLSRELREKSEGELAAQAIARYRNKAADVAKRELLVEKQPSLQFVTPEQLGELAVFLCSPAADNVRGVAWNVDGGWVAQ